MDPDIARFVLPMIMQAVGIALPIVFVGVGYLYLTLDRQRANSPSKDDTQAGLKLVLWGLIVSGVATAAGGTQSLVAYIFGGFKGGSGPIRAAMPTIIVGAVVVLAVAKMLLPRTNSGKERQVERYAMGLLGVSFGVQAIFGLNLLLTGLFNSAPWSSTSGGLAMLAVSGAVAFLALSRFGAASGWTQAAPPAPPMQFPPQQGGGYPPQGGGYPPQGGGYPPQGGGYPPQGGGYPPQGGGGYPPQGGGGYGQPR